MVSFRIKTRFNTEKNRQPCKEIPQLKLKKNMKFSAWKKRAPNSETSREVGAYIFVLEGGQLKKKPHYDFGFLTIELFFIKTIDLTSVSEAFFLNSAKFRIASPSMRFCTWSFPCVNFLGVLFQKKGCSPKESSQRQRS